MKNTSSLGQLIRARRKELRLTTENFAKKVAINRSYISKIERHNYLPSTKILIKIVANLKDNPTKYLRLYESQKFGNAMKAWKKEIKHIDL